MAYGDVGGAVTELVITCLTSRHLSLSIKKDDPVRLIGPYEVDAEGCPIQHYLFGQALADENQPNKQIPIKVHGICIFRYVGEPPLLDGHSGVAVSINKVCRPAEYHQSTGLVLMVDEEAQEVHVLL